MHFTRTIEVPPPPEEAFAYLADFSNTAEWDPGVAEARRLTGAPTRLGSAFEVIALFRGKRQRFEYVVTEFEEGRRVAVHAEGEKAVSDDVVTVEPSGGGSRVTYEAVSKLKGIYRLAEPVVAIVFKRMGNEALDGLERTLDT